MEGLIPFIYRAVVQYRKEGQVSLGDLLFDEPSPTSSYFRLPGDSGRYQQAVTANDLFQQTATYSGAVVGTQRPPVRCPSHRRRPQDRDS